jgi:hypothetical protein
MEALFMRFVAVVVLILSLVTLDSALNLLGSPISFSNLARGLMPAAETQPNPGSLPVASTSLELSVRNNGYFPAVLRATAGKTISLDLVTDGTYSCARDFVIPALKYYQLLPDTGRITVQIPPQPAGTVMRFTCSMGMYTGQIEFE